MVEHTKEGVVGRTPKARIAKTATELENAGVNVDVDVDNEREFTISRSEQVCDWVMVVQVTHMKGKEHNVDVSVDGDTITVQTP